MVELWIARHGQTRFNVEDRVQGMANSELTDTGIVSAQALGRGLAGSGVTFDAAYSSDLTRAFDTAKEALDASGQSDLAVTKLKGLREENYGKFEGQLTNDFSQTVFNMPNFHDALVSHTLTLDQIADATFTANFDQKPNNAETAQMVQQRFDGTLRRIAVENASARRILVVSHGTVVLLWLNYIGFDTQGQELLHNASITRVDYIEGQFHVQNFDDLR